MTDDTPYARKTAFIAAAPNAQTRLSRELALDNIYAWPPPSIITPTSPPALVEFIVENEILLRRLAQLSSPDFSRVVPFRYGQDDMAEYETIIKTLSFFDEQGHRIKSAIISIWEGDRDPVTIAARTVSSCIAIPLTVLAIVVSMENLYPINSADAIKTIATLVSRVWYVEPDQSICASALSAVADIVASPSPVHSSDPVAVAANATPAASHVLACLNIVTDPATNNLVFARKYHDTDVIAALIRDSVSSRDTITNISKYVPSVYRITPHCEWAPVGHTVHVVSPASNTSFVGGAFVDIVWQHAPSVSPDATISVHLVAASADLLTVASHIKHTTSISWRIPPAIGLIREAQFRVTIHTGNPSDVACSPIFVITASPYLDIIVDYFVPPHFKSQQDYGAYVADFFKSPAYDESVPCWYHGSQPAGRHPRQILPYSQIHCIERVKFAPQVHVNATASPESDAWLHWHDIWLAYPRLPPHLLGFATRRAIECVRPIYNARIRLGAACDIVWNTVGLIPRVTISVWCQHSQTRVAIVSHISSPGVNKFTWFISPQFPRTIYPYTIRIAALDSLDDTYGDSLIFFLDPVSHTPSPLSHASNRP
jgi:hypothetical protein